MIGTRKESEVDSAYNIAFDYHYMGFEGASNPEREIREDKIRLAEKLANVARTLEHDFDRIQKDLESHRIEPSELRRLGYFMMNDVFSRACEALGIDKAEQKAALSRFGDPDVDPLGKAAADTWY
jgi:hypothetical protein